jgi:hypothetical protein
VTAVPAAAVVVAAGTQAVISSNAGAATCRDPQWQGLHIPGKPGHDGVAGVGV